MPFGVIDVGDGSVSDTDGTADTMRERAGESRIKLWLLLQANRLLVTAVMAALVFVLFMAGALIEPNLSNVLQNRSAIAYTFSAMVNGLVMGATIVVTINQLIISQENGPLGDQSERMSGALEFRDDVQSVVGEPPPADPSRLLRSLVASTREQADRLRDAVADTSDRRLRSEVTDFCESVIDNAEVVTERLEGAQFGTFDVLQAALDYNYGRKIFRVDQIRHEYDGSLDDTQRDALEGLRAALVLFGPTREHIKTLYFQWELVDLTRLILYTAIPGIVVAVFMMTYITPSTVPGRTIGVENLLWVDGIAFTITMVPFLLLTAYVIRIATVAKRTLAIGPHILRDSKR